MAIRTKAVDQESKTLFAGIDIVVGELILVIRKNGKHHHPQKFTSTPADHATMQH